MMISDKQELRRCVKQTVRRAEICEALLDFDVSGGEIGVEAMLDTWAHPAASPGEALRRATAEHTPFAPDAAAMFAALNAMNMPVRDLDRAQEMAMEYERPAYLREVLDTLHARCVLVRVPMEKAVHFDDDRFEPLIEAGSDLFVPARYGVDYAGAAHRLTNCAQACGARNLLLNRFDAQALRYCLLPLCQDNGYALHVQLRSCEEIDQFALLLDEFDGVRALAGTHAACELHLIETAATRTRLLVCLNDLCHMGEALGKLGTRFVPYSAQAKLPEQMLGRWLLARETIWQALANAYLPLARSGYALDSAAIERDVRRLLSGNLLSLCRMETL
ncbi:MAG: hypothetical protein ACI4MM_09955 [Candidatus Ventricola sp.]